MHFGSFRKKSVKIGKLKKFRKPSRKRRVHSVSGRHYDVFGKASETFLDFRSLPSTHGNCRIEYRHRTKCFEVHYTPFTLSGFGIKSVNPLFHGPFAVLIESVSKAILWVQNINIQYDYSISCKYTVNCSQSFVFTKYS